VVENEALLLCFSCLLLRSCFTASNYCYDPLSLCFHVSVKLEQSNVDKQLFEVDLSADHVT
jgi:hypothetical protein